MLKVNNKYTWATSMMTRSGVFIANLEHISHLFFNLFLTLIINFDHR